MLLRWLLPMVERWVRGVGDLAMVAERYPQAAYAGFAHSFQAEYQYVCRCVPGAEEHLAPLEDAIRNVFIPALLAIPAEEVTDDFRRLLAQSVKGGGLNIRDPVASAPRLLQSSREATAVLVQSLAERSALDGMEHKQCVRDAGRRARKECMAEEAAFVGELKEKASKAVAKRLERIGEAGAWLTVLPNKLDGTLLSAEEWGDNARLRYGLRPIGLCDHCDGCGAGLTVEHALSCKKGGLVSIRHDDVRDEVGALAVLATTNSKVSFEPLIFYGKNIAAGIGAGKQAQSAKSKTAQGKKTRKANVPGDEARGDVAVHGLWKRGQTCVLDVRITDTDAKSYASASSEKVLERAAKQKKDKYLNACLERRRSFTPLVYSVDGLACKEARAFERRIAGLLATKWDRRYSEMAGFVRARMSLAIVRSNTMLLRGSRIGRAARLVVDDGARFDAMQERRGW